MSFDYTGFKLGEKKSLKENEHQHLAAEKLIQDKLGAEWKFIVDWPSIEKATAARNPDCRNHLGTYIYERYSAAIGREISQWGADIAEAVNEAVTDKKIIIGMNPEKVNERYGITVGTSITLLIQPDRCTSDYPYDRDTTVTAIVEKSL